jgi:hypothetical protein
MTPNSTEKSGPEKGVCSSQFFTTPLFDESPLVLIRVLATKLLIWGSSRESRVNGRGSVSTFPACPARWSAEIVESNIRPRVLETMELVPSFELNCAAPGSLPQRFPIVCITLLLFRDHPSRYERGTRTCPRQFDLGESSPRTSLLKAWWYP